MSRLPVDADAIRALAEILADTGLTEIEIAESDSRIRVVRAPAQMVQAYAPPPPVSVTVPGAPGATAALATAAAAPVAEVDYAKHPGAVTSPMVGVAYLSPEPSAAPFVAEGATVTAGQTILLIEAMKTFNQIKAPKGGTLTRLLVGNGSPVEYGEVLAVIE